MLAQDKTRHQIMHRLLTVLMLMKKSHFLRTVFENLYMVAEAPKEPPLLGNLWAIYSGSHSTWTKLGAKWTTTYVCC